MSVLGRNGLIGTGSVAAPVVVFLLLKFTLGLGPESSSAQDGTIDPASAEPVLTAAVAAPTAAQARALGWLADFRIDPDMSSPFQQAEAREPEAKVAPIAIPDPLQSIRLSALLSGSDGDLATLNGKVYRVGDSVAGLTLRTINAREQWVELVGSDGRALRLNREQ